MICMLLRGSRLAALRTKHSVRRYVSSAEDASQQDGSSTPSASVEQAAAEAEDGLESLSDGEAGSLKPYKPRPLPLSPLMDPVLIAARQKWTLPKAHPSKTPTAFQEQLAKNPYARALATPVRKCPLTNIALPKYFLQEFNVMAHPETKEPFYVPRNLTSNFTTDLNQPGANSMEQSQSHETVEDKATGHLEDGMENENHSASAQAEGSMKTKEKEIDDEARSSNTQLPEKSSKIGPSVHLLGRHSLLTSMKEKGGFKYKPIKFGGQRMSRSKAYARVVGRTTWRPDMDDLVLRLMRQRLVENLSYCAGLRKGYVVSCASWEEAKQKSQVGSFLWMGGDEGDGNSGPFDYATLELGKGKARHIPVHNLPALLGDEHVKDLKEKHPAVFENSILALKHRRNTIDLQMQLWKLHGFMAG